MNEIGKYFLLSEVKPFKQDGYTGYEFRNERHDIIMLRVRTHMALNELYGKRTSDMTVRKRKYPLREVEYNRQIAVQMSYNNYLQELARRHSMWGGG